MSTDPRWVAAALLLTVAACAPKQSPSPASFVNNFNGRQYTLERHRPATLDARCLVADDRVLYNPHVDARVARVVFGNGGPLPPGLDIVDYHFDRRTYQVWVTASGQVVARPDVKGSEQELGKLSWQEALARAGLEGGSPPQRTQVEGYFLEVSMQIDWSRWNLEGPRIGVLVTTPIPDVGFSFQITPHTRNELAVSVPWDVPCDRALYEDLHPAL